MVARPETGSIPDAPGSYQFLDAEGRVIYVGKAKSLRSRLSNYFVAPELLLERTRQMVTTAESVEWIVAKNEVDAFFLEFNLIKRHKPRFNVRLKDDKSYPFLAVTLDEEWPRAMVLRGAKRKGVRYFGPYAHAYAIRETLDLLLRTFPIRTCTKNKFDRHHRLGRPCLYAHIEKCAAPCVGAIEREEYDKLVQELLDFLDGEHDAVIKRLEQRMLDAANQQEYELAARVRDQLASVRKAIERQQMVASREEDFDLLGLEEDPLEASVQVFYVRKGRVVGRKGLIVDKVEDLDQPALIARVIEQLYADADAADVPKEILVPVEPEDCDLYEEFLALNRGSKVRIRVPQRGAKRELLQTAMLNARESFARHKLKRASDHNARARALLALQEALDLPEAPLRIECFDISNLQGTEIVGSMVVMEDGLPKRSDYRRFKVRGLDGQDDFASMEDVLTRRFRNYLRERDEGAQAGKRFSYPPNLLLIDGGKGQLNVAVRVLEELGLEDICVASLAKRFEEVYMPGDPEPIRIPRDSEALYLLQQVRDEAHRFAITYHRQLRDKKMITSVLDDITGLGPSRKKRLLKEYGSVKKMRELSEEELTALSWLPDAVAHALYQRLHGLDRADNSTIMSPAPIDVTIITGVSGAGRSEAANVFEDLGFFVIDNLPPMLIGKVAELARGGDNPARYALVVDVRSGDFLADLAVAIDELKNHGARTRVLFLDAADDVLVRRYEASRRRHPLSDTERVVDGIARERGLLEKLKGDADVIVDTTNLNVHELRDRLNELFGEHATAGELQLNVVSFGYKHGLPLDVDLVFDCRFLPNPHWVEALRPHTGLEPDVIEYVMAQAPTGPFLEELDRLLALTLPGFEKEGKAYLSIGVGCTGGRHRSVVIAEQVANMLRKHGYRTVVHHRDIERS